MDPAGAPAQRWMLLEKAGAWLFGAPPPELGLALGLAAGAILLLLVRERLLKPSRVGRALLLTAGRAEMGLLALALGAMVICAVLQIVLRNALDLGLLWIDPLLRYLTLWIGFLGAAVAAASGRHIQIDALSPLLGPRRRRAAGRVTSAAAAVISGALAIAAYRHLANEYKFESREFLELPTWFLLSVIPGALAVMSYRFLGRAIVPPPLPAPELGAAPAAVSAAPH